MTRNEIINFCDRKFASMDVWYILDNQNQLNVIRGILQCFKNHEELTPRQFVRLFDFINDVDMYRIYSKSDLEKRMASIKKIIRPKKQRCYCVNI